MKISIDTKEDSPEEIRKLIRMLAALVGDSVGESSQHTPPASGEGLFDMFGDPAASTTEQQQLGSGHPEESKGENPGVVGDDDFKVVPY